MNEMESNQAEIDGFLRKSMADPVPSLSAEFEERLMAIVARRTEAKDRCRRFMLVGYSLASMVASIVVMRGEGLDWGTTSLAIGGALAVAATAGWVRWPRQAVGA